MKKQEQISTHECWYQLSNFPDSLFANSEAVISHVTKPQVSWICTIKKPEVINTSVHTWLSQFNLKFHRCLIFYRYGPAHIETPHVDCEKITPTSSNTLCSTGINIEITGRGKLQFFDGDPSTGQYTVTTTGQPYISFDDISLGNIIDENIYETRHAYLTRTDVVHRVTGLDDEPRMLASIRYITLENKELSWDESIEMFRACILPR